MQQDPNPSRFAHNVRVELRRTAASARLAVVALGICLALVVGMAVILLREIEDLSRANSDNLQWTLAQIDVEFLRFNLALEQADESPAALDHLRQRFDIFYSRVGILERGEVFRRMRDDPAFDAPRTEIGDFLADAVEFIDAADPVLFDAVPRLQEEAQALFPKVRALSLAGLAAFAEVSDNQREALLRNMVVLASVLALVFAALVMLAYVLHRLYTLARLRGRAVHQAGERMRTIVETSPNAILLTDDAGLISDYNPMAEKIFGHARDAALDRRAIDLIFPPDVAETLRNGALSFLETGAEQSGGLKSFETEAMDRNGRRFPAEIAVVRVKNAPLNIIYVRDISSRKAAEAELTSARDRALAGERAKAEFLAVMSHEMRTPLNGLLGTMQLMRDHDLSEQETDLLDRMTQSGHLLLGLVNDVLDLSKFEAGKMRIENRAFSVSRLLDGVVDTAAALAEANGNTLAWEWVGPEKDAIVGDEKRLRQVLLNLVGNAIKFTRDGMVLVEVELLPGETMIEYRVIDTGIGIAEADIDKIFNDFETLDSSYARQAGGTGLGLGITRRLVELMDGEVGVESEENEGSLFWVRVPVAAQLTDATEAAKPAKIRAARSPVRALDILLVEDNDTNRFVARRMLEAEGHSVTEAENGQIGLDRAQERRFDAILMDISMPVMDGSDAARRIRAGGGPSAQSPIIAVTAHALPEEIAAFRAAGMSLYVSKPIDRAELSATLAEALGQKTEQADTTEPAQAPKPSLVNLGQFEEFLDLLPPERRTEFFDRLVGELDTGIAEIASVGPTADDLQARIHKCAGTCGAIGARALVGELNRLERALKLDNPVTQSELDGLSHLWQDTRGEIALHKTAA